MTKPKKKEESEQKASPKVFQRAGYNFPEPLWVAFVNMVKDVVAEKQSVTGVELVVEISKYFAKSELTSEQMFQGIEKCVTLGHIVELEYSLPEGSNGAGKIKSLFFPKGTRLFLNDE